MLPCKAAFHAPRRHREGSRLLNEAAACTYYGYTYHDYGYSSTLPLTTPTTYHTYTYYFLPGGRLAAPPDVAP